MNSKLLLLGAFTCSVAFYSCSKDDEMTECETSPYGDDGIDLGDMDAFPTEVGSYWVYDLYDVDVDGNETFSNQQDSVYVAGDTLINGDVYTVFRGTFYGLGESLRILRDSSGYIVNEQGNLVHSYTNFNVPLNSETYSSLAIASEMGDEELTSITVPAGTFDAWEKRVVLYKTDDTDVTSCGDETFTLKEYLDPEIGLVYQEFGFVGQIQANCTYRISKLSSYFIAE